MNAIRESAERLMEYLRGNDGAKAADIHAVCSTILAEHPADDETLVDVEWISSLKNACYDDGEHKWFLPGNAKYGMKIYFFLNTMTRPSIFEIYIETEEFHPSYLTDANTRGDVRRLARALKIDLKEGQ